MKLPKIMTPLEFINDIDHEWSKEGIPQEEFTEIHGRLHWCGRLYEEDLEHFINAMKENGAAIIAENDNSEQHNLAFEDYLQSIKDRPRQKKLENALNEKRSFREDMFTLKKSVKLAYEGTASEISFEGERSWPEVRIKWSEKGLKAADLLVNSFPKFVESSKRDAELTIIFSKVMGFDLGVWMIPIEQRYFITNDKGTLFYSKEGKRENFSYETMLPDNHWVFGESEIYQDRKTLIEVLDKAYDSIKEEVYSYSINTQYSRSLFKKEEGCRIKAKFGFSDLDFKPYIPYKSAIELVLKYQSALGNIKTGKTINY